jgi:hypothetical protein
MITLNVEMRFKSENGKKWDPVTGLVRVSLFGCKVFLILISLGIVMWQGYDVTQTYLSKPISTEVKVMPLNSIPNIHLSICTKFEIKDCTYVRPGIPCSVQNLPPFKNNFSYYGEYWKYADLNSTIIKNPPSLNLRNIMDQIQFWNDSGSKWETIFDSKNKTAGDELVIFTRQMYPYFYNHILLCHTLNQDISTIAPLLQFQRTGNIPAFFHFKIILFFKFV